MRKLGPEYIEDAFRWAHEADPSCILLYNDNKVEGIGSKKSQGFYDLLADLKQKNVPVHGCGMQAHFNAAGVGVNRCPTPRKVKEQIRRLGDLGLKVNISEMDVRVSKLPENLQQVAQRQIYHDIVAAALSEPVSVCVFSNKTTSFLLMSHLQKAFDGLYLWGFTDRHTWVTHFYHDDEPLIFDEDYRKKGCYFGLRDALSMLIPGGCVGGHGVLLNSDVDINGKPWGHLWMQPDPAPGPNDTTASGDSRPDWEQENDDGYKEEDSGDKVDGSKLPPLS